MDLSPAQELLEMETRVRFGDAPRGLDGDVLGPDSWMLIEDQFLLRQGEDHWFYYRKGVGVTIDRGPAADPSIEPLWLHGSVYSAVASINGFLPIHASAVCHEGSVHAFTGPSGAGKSTLVTALSAGGLAMFCDDTLVLDLSDPDRVVCLPGHKRLKLTAEALALTGADREEKVAKEVEKFYARAPETYSGKPLPLARLVFLEEGEGPAFERITGAQRMVRLSDDHYTALHFAAARQFDPASHFAHLSRLARQIEMSRFVRPRDLSRFRDGVEAASAYIRGTSTTDGS